MDSVLHRLAAEAVRLGADTLEVEYRNGYEEVVAMSGALGQRIARYRSSRPEAASLRKDLQAIARRKRRMTLDGHEYEVCCRTHDSFGEHTYRLKLTRPSE